LILIDSEMILDVFDPVEPKILFVDGAGFA
jgi:hypothetical protein